MDLDNQVHTLASSSQGATPVTKVLSTMHKVSVSFVIKPLQEYTLQKVTVKITALKSTTKFHIRARKTLMGPDTPKRGFITLKVKARIHSSAEIPDGTRHPRAGI